MLVLEFRGLKKATRRVRRLLALLRCLPTSNTAPTTPPEKCPLNLRSALASPRCSVANTRVGASPARICHRLTWRSPPRRHGRRCRGRAGRCRCKCGRNWSAGRCQLQPCDAWVLLPTGTFVRPPDSPPVRRQIKEIKSELKDPSFPWGVDLLLPQVGGTARKTNRGCFHSGGRSGFI